MIKIAPRIKIAPNVQKRLKTSKKYQKCSKSFKTLGNVQKCSKCFPVATEPQDLCRSRRHSRSGRRCGCHGRRCGRRRRRCMPRRCRAAAAAGAIFFKALLLNKISHNTLMKYERRYFGFESTSVQWRILRKMWGGLEPTGETTK